MTLLIILIFILKYVFLLKWSSGQKKWFICGIIFKFEVKILWRFLEYIFNKLKTLNEDNLVCCPNLNYRTVSLRIKTILI